MTTTQSPAVHEKVLNQFRNVIAKNRMAHAYLFVGPAECGKSETAYALAKYLVCEEPSSEQGSFYCGKCSACLKVEAQCHPDVHVTSSPEGERIKMEQARQLLTDIRLRPFMASKKVFIIKDIDTMTTEGSNALLKTLEEPGPDSLLILTTAVIEKVLDTVRSRCHILYFSAESEERVEKYLIASCNEDLSAARFLSRFSKGAITQAQRLSEDGFFTTKNEWLDEYVLATNVDAFLKSIVSDKNVLKDFLAVVLAWVRDAMLVKSGVEESRLVHQDRFMDLDHFQKRFSFAELNMQYKEIVKSSKLLADNLNIKMSLLIIKEML